MSRRAASIPPTAAIAEPSARTRRIAGVLLTLLLLVLAFRLTSAETLRLTLNQKVAEVETAMRAQQGEDVVVVPIVGPPFIAAYAFLSFGLAGIASILAARVGALNLRRAAQGAWMALIVVLGLVSTFLAANRFNAVIGTADIACALAAAWTVTLMCDDRLLGRRGRQVVIAAMIAICAVGCAKAMLQKFDEFPATLQEVMKDPDAAMRHQGIDPNDHVQRESFLSRLRSAEVIGYGALSNVFATQMIAVIGMLAGLVVGGLAMRQGAMPEPASPPSAAAAQVAKRRGSQRVEPGAGGVPLATAAMILLAVLLVGSLAALAFTESKGGIIAGALTLAVIVVGILLRGPIARRRRAVIVSAGVACVVFFGVVVGWGLTHHGLPTRSLLFRWHYWTGAVPIIEAHPLAGVGLNNFGDYYARFKLASSPEDVKDPHNFFVRLASEGGIPLALAVGVLLFWMLQGAWSIKAAAQRSAEQPVASGFRASLVLAGWVAIVWVPLHFLAERYNEYAFIITVLCAGGAWLVFAGVMALLEALAPAATRVIVLAGIIAALGMLLYDQINMALVTGPVAMLFWMMLALGESTYGGATSTRKSLATILLNVSGMVGVVLLCVLAYGIVAWDPAPYEYAYIHHISAGEHIRTPVTTNGATTHSFVSKISDVEALRAFESLDDAIERAPNSIELRLQRITLLRDVLHKPVADEIRTVLAMDNANAGLRILLALPESDLPAGERVRALREALAFDRQLSPGELKSLKPEMIKQINETIERLQATQAKPAG